jgi:hypothetical protein
MTPIDLLEADVQDVSGFRRRRDLSVISKTEISSELSYVFLILLYIFSFI